MKRQPRIDDLTDRALGCFVLWCRMNPPDVVCNGEVVRRVLHAYAAADRTAP